MEKKVAKLVSINFDNTYKNTLLFGSRTEQANFFNNLNGIYYNDFLMLYKSKNTTRINLNSEEVRKYNYLYVTNLDGTYTYYFITNFYGYNEEVTELDLEIDVWNTYYFDRQIMPCLIDREHSASDEIGEHIEDEGLDVGDIIFHTPKKIILQSFLGNQTVENSEQAEITDVPTVIVGVSEVKKGGTWEQAKGTTDGGTYSAISFKRFDLFSIENNEFTGKKLVTDYDKFNELNVFIQTYVDDNKLGAIQAIFSYPKKLLTTDIALIDDSVSVVVHTDKQKNNGYLPKNKKLLTSPFKNLVCSNATGTTTILQNTLNNFNEQSDEVEFYFFKITQNIKPNAEITLIPRDYNNKKYDLENTTTVTGFPIGNLISDNLANWYAKNKTDLVMSGISTVGTMALGVATGNPLAIGGALSFAVNTIGTAVKENQKADTVQGSKFDGSVLMGNCLLDFYFYETGLTEEKAKIIDEFFSNYGYKCNRLKIPNIAVRPHYTYTKTVNCLINGRIPIEHKKQIEKIFDDGVTIWRNENNIGNYNLENGVN